MTTTKTKRASQRRATKQAASNVRQLLSAATSGRRAVRSAEPVDDGTAPSGVFTFR